MNALRGFLIVTLFSLPVGAAEINRTMEYIAGVYAARVYDSMNFTAADDEATLNQISNHAQTNKSLFGTGIAKCHQLAKDCLDLSRGDQDDICNDLNNYKNGDGSDLKKRLTTNFRVYVRRIDRLPKSAPSSCFPAGEELKAAKGGGYVPDSESVP